MEHRFRWDVRPAALSQNLVSGTSYRFTVLTPQLLRLEYSPDGIFEDRASQMAFYRDFAPCTFTHSVQNGTATLETEALLLTYTENAPFALDTLSIRLKCEPASTWHFGEAFETLGGTAETLDQVDGPCYVEHGVCSRNGFSVLDDSRTVVLEEDGWIGVRRENTVDLYFFGYGFDYPGALRDFYRLTGAHPLLPAYALGNWWSRYYAYTQQEYLDLMDRFRDEGIPFSVGVVDMDWHITEIPEELKMKDSKVPFARSGWTGYSWNKELFPDYKAFLRQLHERNLKTALNLHPASGTRCHEDMYEEMARANGIDPATRAPVNLDLLSKQHMATYFDILHHPYEEDGVDFWWMDWQQGKNYWWVHDPNPPGEYADPRERVDPLWMLNHLHILDISRTGKRPMFFSRYSGPGSHRYPVGFSGDTAITWDTLRFQPEFTATASNIGYGWWSHDIGGHHFGVRDDELYLRWIQLGVFSPINRLHSTKNPFICKEPWNYPDEIGQIAKQFLRLRHRLFPYLYTMNHRCHTQLQPLVQPMYYAYPKCHDAYTCPTQFFFGSELMVCPITRNTDRDTMLARADVWLPQGSWFDFFTGQHYRAARAKKKSVFRPLAQMPVFAKPGAIVPMADYDLHDNRLLNADRMEVLVFPEADGTFTLYEDAGEGSAYGDGAFAQTKLTLHWGEQAELTIHPAQGDLSLIPAVRTWKIGLRGWHKDAAQGQWDPQTNTLWITVTAEVTQPVTLRLAAKITDNADNLARCEQILIRAQIANSEKIKLMESLSNGNRPLKKRITELRTFGHCVVNPLLEQLTLTEDPFMDQMSFYSV